MSIKSLLQTIVEKINYRLVLRFPNLMKQKEFSMLKNLRFDKDAKDFEPELLFITQLIKKETTVVDVGANLGLYLFQFEKAKCFKEIIGFEPYPKLYKRLKALFPKLSIYDFALSNVNETKKLKTPFIRNRRNSFRSTLESIKEEDETGEEFNQVHTITLDSFAEKFKVQNVGFIKIDVEGHEWKVLKGAREIINHQHPVLMLEIEQRHHPNQPIEDILRNILAMGYKGFYFDKRNLSFSTVENFSVTKNQNLDHYIYKDYINNFLFFPNELSIEERLKNISSQFENSNTQIS